MPLRQLSGNIGEWSEIYVFLYLLANGKLVVADEELNAIPEEFYKILAIIRKETSTTNNYVREDDKVNIFVTNDTTGEIENFSFPIGTFIQKTAELLEGLKSTGGGRYPEITAFLSELKVYSIKDIGHKRDITIRIEDFHCGMVQTLGFSIKSFLGANSTLFNAGAGTNFIYEVCLPYGVEIDVDKFNSATYPEKNRISARVISLKDKYKADFKFAGIQSSCLQQNLRTIDGDLPDLLSRLLLARFYNKTPNLKDCTDAISEQNPYNFDIEHLGAVYEYKVKRFLQDCALGMTPETPWTGFYDATGGQIIVKQSGEVVCYHIYEINRFLEYLYSSTKFESPSTSENKDNPGNPRPNASKQFFYGWLYKEEDKLYLKLNLQIRFK